MLELASLTPRFAVCSCARTLIIAASAMLVACGGDAPSGPGGGDGGGGGSVPPTPNFVHLESDPTDFVGGGRTYSYDQANAVIAVTATNGHFRIQITGDEPWLGDFTMPSTMARLEPGAYSGVAQYPAVALSGAMNWEFIAAAGLRACSGLTASFTVDSLTYSGSTLTAIDLRFDQQCGGSSAVLRGSIHWRADDQTRPAGPAAVPDDLWRPPSSLTGDYVYFSSDSGDYIGKGATYTYTPPDAQLSASTQGNRLTLALRASVGDTWDADIQGMNVITQLERGYYADLHRFPFGNPLLGEMDWAGMGYGCNELVGWVAIDQITYTDGVLRSLTLRFEQHCEEAPPALHGAIHWDW